MPHLRSEPPKALVIHCIDPRFQKAFDEFIHEKLGLDEGEYIPLLVPGGIASVGMGISEFLPKNHKVLREQIQLALEVYQAQEPRVILINHEDCRAYASLMKKLPSFAIHGMTMLTRQMDDLKVASTLIEQITEKTGRRATFELYMARIGNTGEIVFEPIA